MKLLNSRGQSTGEYAILFAIVLGAVIAMQNYVKNRIAAGIRGQADTYAAAAGGVAAGITTTGNSDSNADATMTNAQQGRLNTDNTGHNVTNYPE